MILLLTPLQLFKTLSDDTRLSIVLLLREMGELCVCDIGAALDAPQPKISRHRKEGKWVHYRLSPQMPAWAARVIEEAWEADRTAARNLAAKLTSGNGTADGKSFCL